MTAGYVKVGPWGGKDGTQRWPFDLEGDRRLIKITICSDSECVYSIQFTSLDVNTRASYDSPLYGGVGGKPETAAFDPEDDTEHLVEIGGTFGCHHAGRVVITSLFFKTSINKKYGPYGPGADRGDTPFSLPVEEGKVAGFFGKFGDRLDNLGVKLKLG